MNGSATLVQVEQLLQLLLAARLADPDILEEHAKALEGFGHFLIKRSDLVPLVIQKVQGLAICWVLSGSLNQRPMAPGAPILLFWSHMCQCKPAQVWLL